MDRLVNYLPSFYKNDLDIDIQNAFEKEIDLSSEEIEDYLNQFFIDTATWGLNDWEEMCRIKTNSDLSYETRRANIKAKLRGRATTTNKVLESICEAYTKRPASVKEYSNDFLIVLNIIINVCPHETIVELDKFIEKIKPCHLIHKFIMSLINKNRLNVGAISLTGEEIAVYPWSIKNIETKGKYNLALGTINGVEEISIYPEKKEVI